MEEIRGSIPLESTMQHIRLVDGFKIRQTLDTEFIFLHTHRTEASSYDHKFYIPEDEWWLDHRVKDEQAFLSRMEMLQMPREDMSYQEQREETKKQMCAAPPIPDFVRSRKKESGLADIVVVDGTIVRQYIDPSFVFGGHHYVYPYVPENEIWLDDRMDPQEIPFVLLHEEIERNLMIEGKSYDVAHEYAVVAEKELRRKHGASYPGDAGYPYYGWSNEQLAALYYVSE